jgi:hypothetical protein
MRWRQPTICPKKGPGTPSPLLLLLFSVRVAARQFLVFIEFSRHSQNFYPLISINCPFLNLAPIQATNVCLAGLALSHARKLDCIFVLLIVVYILFCVSMAVNLADWEDSKENIKPLREGRDPVRLSETFRDPQATANKLIQERQYGIISVVCVFN